MAGKRLCIREKLVYVIVLFIHLEKYGSSLQLSLVSFIQTGVR